ncbi:MAG TPA: GxxExxY protein [Longimicrobiales bacterium]|nr:GxxExxY protein [Longimicrobiales bacterium]
MEINEITDRVLAAAVEVHRRLGPGLLESPYAECLAFEMRRRGLRFRREVRLPLVYDGHRIDCAYRLDFLVGGQVVLELKAERSLQPIHGAQLLTYLRLGGFPVGLLLNFNTRYLGGGSVRRVVNGYAGPRPSGDAAQ